MEVGCIPPASVTLGKLVSQSLCFLTCNMGITTPTSQNCVTHCLTSINTQ